MTGLNLLYTGDNNSDLICVYAYHIISQAVLHGENIYAYIVPIWWTCNISMSYLTKEEMKLEVNILYSF